MPDSGNYERKYFMNKTMKKIVAAAVATASIAVMSVTASADTKLYPPVSWSAVFSPGAPTGVNKTYCYELYTFGNGYEITCNTFLGDYDRNVKINLQYNITASRTITLHIDDIHAPTYSPIIVANPANLYGDSLTFTFKATSSKPCEAYGIISHHK